MASETVDSITGGASFWDFLSNVARDEYQYRQDLRRMKADARYRSTPYGIQEEGDRYSGIPAVSGLPSWAIPAAGLLAAGLLAYVLMKG